jgi:hypothetical protein
LTKTSPVPTPFASPQSLEPALAGVRDYWLGLRRGQADIPFADDVKLSAVSDAGADPILVDVFERPFRFRIAVAGRSIVARYGQPIEGLFADEVVPKAPLDFFLSQCSATLEARAPTYYRASATPSYSRLILPLWGDGHVNGLICAIA